MKGLIALDSPLQDHGLNDFPLDEAARSGAGLGTGALPDAPLLDSVGGRAAPEPGRYPTPRLADGPLPGDLRADAPLNDAPLA